jgi:hypothetical protein
MAVVQARRRDQDDRLAMIVLALPTVILAQTLFGPDVLGAALALFGLALWRASPSHKVAAVAAFALAMLARESTVLVPAVIGAFELFHRSLRLRHAALLATPLVVYLGWMLVVRARLGAGPEYGDRALGSPFGVLLAGWPSEWSSTDALVLLSLLGFLVAVVIRHRRELEAWITGVYVGAAVVLAAEAVWQSWTYMGRILIPATVLAVTVLWPRRRTPASENDEPDVSPTGGTTRPGTATATIDTAPLERVVEGLPFGRLHP